MTYILAAISVWFLQLWPMTPVQALKTWSYNNSCPEWMAPAEMIDRAEATGYKVRVPE